MISSKVIRKRGTVSVQMTAQDIISLAVNVVQNGQSLDDLGCASAEEAQAQQTMLAEIYHQVLSANRQAASRFAHERRHERPASRRRGLRYLA